MLLNLLSTNYPANNSTDGQYLYRSLGSFWTQIFQDKNVLKGYTTGMAEELIQAYYNLIETVQQFSVKDISILHKEKWQPLTIKKSEFNKTPFLFQKNGAVFGYQPEDSALYANQMFRFGFPKQTGGTDTFSYTPTEPIKKFGAIANRIIAPSLMLLPGINVYLSDGNIYFNINIFDNEYVPRAKVLGEFGAPITFKDVDGNVLDDEFVILWLYNAEVDNEDLYNNFGALYDLRLNSSESYKEILKTIINLSVEGPTIAALTSAYAALANVPVIIEPTEVVEDIYDDMTYNYVITDKHVYRTEIDHPLNVDVLIGNKLHAGSCITNDINIVDTVMHPTWWQKELSSNKLAFSSHVFAADVKNQLFFENTISLITYTAGKIDFPVFGRDKDVAAFKEFINLAENKRELLSALNMAPGTTAAIAINPIDFVFKNIFKNNTLLVKLQFYSNAQLDLFFSLLPVIQEYLPAHVYMLVYLTLQLPADELPNLNSSMYIEGFGFQKFSWDGSQKASGSRPQLAGEDLDYYKDYTKRLFCVSVGPYRHGLPLHDQTNLDSLPINNNGHKDMEAGIKCGLMRTEIPLRVQPPGETAQRAPSTREIPSILLIDF